MEGPRRRLSPDELLRSKVGANIRRSLRRLWAGDMEFDELLDAVQPTLDGVRAAVAALRKEGKETTLCPHAVVAEMRLDPDAVVALAKEMGLGEREEPECYIPTPEEIRLATAKILAGLTPEEREQRLGGPPMR